MDAAFPFPFPLSSLLLWWWLETDDLTTNNEGCCRIFWSAIAIDAVENAPQHVVVDATRRSDAGMEALIMAKGIVLLSFRLWIL